jgi:hypothetical protein
MAIIRPNLLFLLAVCTIGLLRILGYLSLTQSFLLIAAATLVKFLIEGLSSPLSLGALIIQKVRKTASDALTVLRLEKAVHLAFIGRRFIDSPREQSNIKTFHFRRASSYELTFYSLCFALVIEIPFVHLIVHYQVAAEYRSWTHLILAFFSLYGLIWLISDKRAVGTTCIYFGDEALELRVGWRQCAWIPQKNIVYARLLQQSIRSFRKTVNCSRCDVTVVTPMDDPNVILELRNKDANDVKIEFLGFPRRGTRYIAIFVDDPSAFIRHCGPREHAGV